MGKKKGWDVVLVDLEGIGEKRGRKPLASFSEKKERARESPFRQATNQKAGLTTKGIYFPLDLGGEGAREN